MSAPEPSILIKISPPPPVTPSPISRGHLGVHKFFFCPLMLLLFLLLFVSPGIASSRLAVLISTAGTPYNDVLAGLQDTLKKSGADVNFSILHLDGEPDKAEILVDQLSTERPDLIVTLGNLALDTAAEKITDIPIVAGMILSREKIQNYQNVTGVVLAIPVDVQFAWLKKFFPQARNVGVFYNPDENGPVVDKASKEALRRGLHLVARPITSPLDLPVALKEMASEVDVVWGLNDQVVLNKKTAKNILLFSFRNKIPFIGLSHAWVKAGAYYALDRDYRNIGVQCSEIIEQLLGGAKIDTISPAAPRKITYSINRRMAEKMGREIEQSLINEAYKVF